MDVLPDTNQGEEDENAGRQVLIEVGRELGNLGFLSLVHYKQAMEQ